MNFNNEKELIRQAGAQLSPHADKRMLASVIEKFNSRVAPPPEHAIGAGWPLRIAVAAMIIIVAGFFVYKHTGTVDPINPAYGLSELVRATSSAQWVRMTGKFRPLLGSPAARIRKTMADFQEVWYCGNPSMLVVKFGSGNIQIIKPSQTIYYSAKENVVTITKKPQRDFKLYEISDMLESMLENAQGQGAKIKYEQATYDNQPAIRVHITRTSDSGFSDTSVMAEKTSRRIRATSSVTYNDNSKLVNFDNKFEYPATGPRDIFEAGAPPDAKIIAETDF